MVRMYKLFGILLLSALFTGALIVPFIDLLYYLKFRVPKVKSVDEFGRETPFNEILGHKVGTPTGGGVLLIFAAFLFSLIFYGFTQYALNWTAAILFLTLFSFGLVGVYDDARKFFRPNKESLAQIFDFKKKLIVELALGSVIGWLLYSQMGLGSLNIPVVTAVWGYQLKLGLLFIPFAAVTITASSNAFNITDGLDGLSGGLLMIALSAFWVLTSLSPYGGDVALFIAIIMGTLIPYLYFNVNPARLFYGDTAALAFGAMLAVVALMLNQALVLPIIGGVFVVDGASSLIQILSYKLRDGKRVFKIAPLHHHFQAIGWEETKVTTRFWIAGVLLAFIGLFLATFGIK